MAPIPTLLLNRRPALVAVAGLLAVVSLAACGDDSSSSADRSATDPTTTTALVDDPESPYCRTALEWQVHELDPVDQSDPDALHAYFDDYVEFYATATEQAPDEIADDWAVSNDALNNLLVPVVERYGYDVARMAAEGTPEEAALFDDPPAEVVAAQTATHAYESRVCGAGQPAAATDVTFTGDADSTYCRNAAEFDGAFGEIVANGAQADEVEAFMTDSDNLEALATAYEDAPEDIAADEQALDEFAVDVQLPVIESYDFDFRRLLLEASPDERARFQYTDPEIREQFMRVQAYAEQVCGAESNA